MDYAENFVNGGVALIFMGLAVFALIDTVRTLVFAITTSTFASAATNAINGLLFVVVIVEITGTVYEHYGKKGLQLQLCLMFGIVTTVHEVMALAARLSLNSNIRAQELQTCLLEMAINAVVIFGLTASLALIRRYSSSVEEEDGAEG